MLYHKEKYVDIYHADCREVIPRLDDMSVQMVITSGSCIRGEILPLDYNMGILNLMWKPLIRKGVVFWHVISDPKEFTDRAEQDGWVTDVIDCGKEHIAVFGKQEDYLGNGPKPTWDFPEDRTLTICAESGETIVDMKLLYRGGNARNITFPGVFPIGMVENCIRLATDYFKYGAILDPCCGSGTVGVVAKKILWKSILIDQNELSCEMAKLRTERA